MTTHAFNPDLEAGGCTFNLGHTFCWKCHCGGDFKVFFSTFTQCDSVTVNGLSVACGSGCKDSQLQHHVCLHSAMLPAMVD